jgi:hypothetical protein
MLLEISKIKDEVEYKKSRRIFLRLFHVRQDVTRMYSEHLLASAILNPIGQLSKVS